MAAVGSDGTILSRARTSTPDRPSPGEFLSAVASLADQCRAAMTSDIQIAAISAAVPATFKAAEGILTKLPNLPSLNGMDLKTELAARFCVPVTLENDATAAGI